MNLMRMPNYADYISGDVSVSLEHISCFSLFYSSLIGSPSAILAFTHSVEHRRLLWSTGLAWRLYLDTNTPYNRKMVQVLRLLEGSESSTALSPKVSGRNRLSHMVIPIAPCSYLRCEALTISRRVWYCFRFPSSVDDNGRRHYIRISSTFREDDNSRMVLPSPEWSLSSTYHFIPLRRYFCCHCAGGIGRRGAISEGWEICKYKYIFECM